MTAERKPQMHGAGDWLFWVSVLVSVLWCASLALIAYHRSPDYQPLLSPVISDPPRSLTLNEIGDTLAGAFAPLAFLWFFVSTWLQRTELKETRQVFIDQQVELERTAKENVNQTKIMQRQLETAQFRTVFEEHRLRLYYLAKYIVQEKNENITHFVGEQPYRLELFDPIRSIHPTSSALPLKQDDDLVDSILARFGETVQKVSRFPSDVRTFGGERFLYLLREIQRELEDLVQGSAYVDNPLIRARITGTGLRQVYGDLEAAVERLGTV